MSDQRDLEMFGCTKADLIEMLEDSIGMQEMLAMSILSDAQLVMGANPELARQYINKAKWVMSQIMQNKMAA